MGGLGLNTMVATGTGGNAQAPSYGNQNLQNAATNFQTQYGSNPFVQAAQANTMGNIQGAQTATAANRVNQQTPFGSLQYTQTGTDSSGNPIWSANQTFSPEVAGTMSQLSNQISQNINQGFNPNTPSIQYGGQGPTLGQVGQSGQAQGMGNAPTLQTNLDFQGMEGWDKATGLLMNRLNPQIAQSEERLQAQLANQGIAPGTEAYNRAMMQQGQRTNDLLTQAQLAGQNVQQNMFGQALQGGQFANQAMLGQNQAQGANTQLSNQAIQQNYANQLAAQQMNNQALQQMFANQQSGANLSNQAQQQAYNQAFGNYNLPLAQLGAYRQATSPTYVNPYTQAAVAGPDILGAYTSSEAARIAQQNADAAKQAALTGGLFQLGGSALSNPSAVSGLGGLINKGIGAAGDFLGGLF